MNNLIDLVEFDKPHREMWFKAGGILLGMNEQEKYEFLNLFNGILDDPNFMSKWGAIVEHIESLVRNAAFYLHSKMSFGNSQNPNESGLSYLSKRTFVYRYNFNIEDYLESFSTCFLESIDIFKKYFSNINSDLELRNLFMKNYFKGLWDNSKVEDYERILREVNLNKILK